MNKRLLQLSAVIVLVVLLAAGGFIIWQKFLHTKGQSDLIKNANASYPNDVRYASFGADYVFAVPKSFLVDETSVTGIQLLLPTGSNLSKGSNLDQLYDAGVVAVQPGAQIKANDNSSLVDYMKKSIIPDLQKNVGPDVTVTYSMPGNYKAATAVVKRDGKTVRQLYAYGGSHPYLVASKERSDAYVEASTTMIETSLSKYKDDIESIKQVIKSDMTMLQQGQIQGLYDSGTTALKASTTVKDLTNTINTSASYIHQNILAPGGSIQSDQFAGQLYFPGANKDDQGALGLITLKKEDGQWKLAGLQLPSKKAN